MTTEVVVLMGGRSSERDVSIMSGVAVSESLRDNGYNVTKIDFQNGDLLLEQLVKKSPDVIRALALQLHYRLSQRIFH